MQNGVGDAIGLTTEQVNLLAAQGAVRLSRCLPVAGNSWGKLQEVHGGCPKSMVSIYGIIVTDSHLEHILEKNVNKEYGGWVSTLRT